MDVEKRTQLKDLAENVGDADITAALYFYADYADQIDRLNDLVQENPRFFSSGAGMYKVKVAVDYLEKAVNIWTKRYVK